MKKSDVELKLFREGFDSYEKLSKLEDLLRRTKYELDKRFGEELGNIEDKNDIFTDEELLKLRKLSMAIGRAYDDINNKKWNYRETLIWKNLKIDEEKNVEAKNNEDEYY